MDETRRRHLRRALECGLPVLALSLVGALWTATSTPASLSIVATFALLVLVVENAAVLLPSSAGISPSLMLEIAAITALGARHVDGPGIVLAAAVIGFCGGIFLDCLRDRRFSVISFNCGQLSIALAAAASVYVALPDGPAWSLVAAAAAVAVHATVNAGLVLPWVSATYGRRPGEVWTDMRPAVPNAMAFGLLGILVGQLYNSLGPLSLPLLLIPAAIARTTFSSYLELRRAHEAAVHVFVRAIDAKDRYTAGHCDRVAKYAAYIGEELGFSPAQLEHLRYAALMHDVGKLAVPSSLLNKPGRLTPDEFAQIRRHNEVCIDILTRVDFLRSTVPAASDAHAHFAAGEPRHDAEALEAYAIAVADAFDAMTSTRSYRRALPQAVAFGELRDKSGTQFHPESADALIRAIERRGETYGFGHETDVEEFDVAPPVAGLGSAGLGDLLPEGVA